MCLVSFAIPSSSFSSSQPHRFDCVAFLLLSLSLSNRYGKPSPISPSLPLSPPPPKLLGFQFQIPNPLFLLSVFYFTFSSALYFPSDLTRLFQFVVFWV
ncbi:hypothetical protein RJT34_03778 [Clitoria ternatea]|uniref:Uncharacterized protein n=1 Tax=Clitoria ternatea TaxID=43366 RepID=A0AAN9KLD0_CLITE